MKKPDESNPNAAVSRIMNDPKNISILEYDYLLPADRIANFPLEKRDASKLLVYKDGQINDDLFLNLPDHLSEALLVLNNTRVIEARIHFQKSSGGQIEIFCLQPHGQSMEQSLQQTEKSQWLCLIGGASKWKHGQLLQKEILVQNKTVLLTAAYIEKKEDGFIIEFSWSPSTIPFSSILHAAGNIPLPPYIKRKVVEQDKERYQTVFSKTEGSVAAPTAALHFTPRIFDALQKKNVEAAFITLHVGAGTFKPVKSATIGGHIMHEEPFSVTRLFLKQLLNAKQVIAVGTTSLRTLESLHWLGVKIMKGQLDMDLNLSQWEAYDLQEENPSITFRESLQAMIGFMEKKEMSELQCTTSMVIVPGYDFKIPSALITNFHQPQSTLLLLVSAFIGDDWKKVYEHALTHQYRFLSYGDSSLLWRKK